MTNLPNDVKYSSINYSKKSIYYPHFNKKILLQSVQEKDALQINYLERTRPVCIN